MPVHYVYLLFKIIIILRSNHIKILLIFAMVNYLGSLNVFTVLPSIALAYILKPWISGGE